MWEMLWPIALVVLANIFYNIVTKSTPSDGNAMLSLTVTYLVGGLCAFGLYWLGKGREGLWQDLGRLNWTSFALGLVVVGLEFGYIHVYRAGWNVNTAPLVANICLACALLFVGFLLFHETLTLRQLLGVAVCVGGLVLVAGK
ncbi:MAG: hypothetical protein IIY93_07390 [Clostridia bacterium]|nr:hypothetical protein [Clostridia bacterium]MBQ1555299.1 hypothetical protein [Clostridia bacterium]